jgi:hypothetical protein
MPNPYYLGIGNACDPTAVVTDFSDLVKFGGITVGINDVDSEDSGRGLDGTMYRSRVGVKARLDVECRPMSSYDLSRLLTALSPVFVNVTYFDPETNAYVTKTMYAGNRSMGFAKVQPNGTILWENIKFPLIER